MLTLNILQAHFRVSYQHPPHHVTRVFGVKLVNGGKLVHTSPILHRVGGMVA